MGGCSSKTNGNYLIKNTNPENHEAWHNVKQLEADRMLLTTAGLEIGTFILRPSAALETLALSVKSWSTTREIIEVKHFRIFHEINKDNGMKEFFIRSNDKKNKTFENVFDLIRHYQTNQDRSCIKLNMPFPMKLTSPINFEDFEVDRKCIILNDEIGRGHFGAVYKATWNKNLEVAVKTHHSSSSTDSANFIAEAITMHSLNHENIVRLLGVCTKPETDPIYLILEICENGSLKDFLKSDKAENIKFCHLIEILQQISMGMQYLANKMIVHSDLRAANVLVDANKKIKVADFGLSRNYGNSFINSEKLKEKINSQESEKDNKKLKEPLLPWKWTAPEVISMRLYSEKSDIWSFAVVIFEVVTYGCTPYPNHKTKNQLFEDLKNGFRMKNPAELSLKVTCTKEIYDLMQKCWLIEPSKRPTFEYINKYLGEIIDSMKILYE